MIFAAGTEEFTFFIETLQKQGLLEGRASGVTRLTPDGWLRVADLKKNRPDSTQAFVAMWFDSEMEAAYERGFRPALVACGFEPLRIDRKDHNNKIDDEIVSEIRRSALVIADFTGNRGGVYFEAGLALGLGLNVVWTCRFGDQESLHFDTRQYNHILWENPEDLELQLKRRLQATGLARA